MNTIKNIKKRFTDPVQPEPKWLLHWYGHIYDPNFGCVRVDHLGIVQHWNVTGDRPHIYEEVKMIPERDIVMYDDHYDLDPIMSGTVLQVRHNSRGGGGDISVLFTGDVLVHKDGKTSHSTMYTRVPDDVFGVIQAQRTKMINERRLTLPVGESVILIP